MPHRPSSLRWLALISALAFTLVLLLSVAPLSAQNGAVDVAPVTIPAGREATLAIKAFCIEYTNPFAKEFPPMTGPAEQKYVQILRYALSKGYVDSDPYQVQLALWRAQMGRWVNTVPRARAEEIFNNASQAPPTPAPQGQSLVDALKANMVQVTYRNWAPVRNGLPDSIQPWLGVGEIVVKNTGNAPLTLTLPQGIFLDAKQGEQDMLMFFTGVQAQATDTPVPATATRVLATATRAPATTDPRATPRPLPQSGFDAPDDPAYLVLVAGGLLFVLGLAADLVRRCPRVRRF